MSLKPPYWNSVQQRHMYLQADANVSEKCTVSIVKYEDGALRLVGHTETLPESRYKVHNEAIRIHSATTYF
jgi:hypothetical protein